MSRCASRRPEAPVTCARHGGATSTLCFPRPSAFNRRPVSVIIHRVKSVTLQPSARELLIWCAPALLLGAALRIALMMQMPNGFLHDDSPDFLQTADRLLHEGEFDIHGKKTFLTPVVFTIPFLIRAAALTAIPAFHHLLGLGLVVVIGSLCRLWFKHWKWFIVPLTLLTATNPFLLWYEHTLMAETLFVFCTALVALAGTLYALDQSWRRFAFLGGALFLDAGARPEGKLLFGFALLLLVLLPFREWRSILPRFAVMAALAVVTHLMTKTSQAGLLLYTSVARFTPSELRCAPGFDPFIAPIRKELQERWSKWPSFPKVRDRRAVAEAVEQYLRSSGSTRRLKHADVNGFCLKLAVETCWRSFFRLPEHAYHKFRFVASESPSGLLDDKWLFEKQTNAWSDLQKTMPRIVGGLTSQAIATEAELNDFISSRYREVGWFNSLHDRWLAAVNAWRFPDTKFVDPGNPRSVFIYPGVPLYFLLAAIGAVVLTLRRGVLQPFHIAWVLTLFGFFYVIMLTGNVRSRFRFVFEPFWFVYIGILIDSLWIGLTGLFRSRSAPALTKPQTMPELEAAP